MFDCFSVSSAYKRDTHLAKLAAYFVDMMEASLMSSDQMRAVQSPTVRKFLGKKGFLCRA